MKDEKLLTKEEIYKIIFEGLANGPDQSLVNINNMNIVHELILKISDELIIARTKKKEQIIYPETD